MPEYECVVAKVHKRLYGVVQEHAPVCCGKPMVLTHASSQAEVFAQPTAVANDCRALWSHEVPTIPQKEKNWWQLWK